MNKRIRTKMKLILDLDTKILPFSQEMKMRKMMKKRMRKK